MGVAGSASRHTKTTPPTAKEKRKKTPKPQSPSVATPQSTSQAAKKERHRIKKPKPVGPGTRPGAHQELPITIDSDDESGSVVSLETNTTAAVRAYSLPVAPIIRGGIYPGDAHAGRTGLPHIPEPTSFDCASPVRQLEGTQHAAPFALPLHDARKDDSKVYEERLVSAKLCPPGNLRKAPTSHFEQRHRRAQATHAGLYSRYARSTPTLNSPTAQSSCFVDRYIASSLATSDADDGVALTLADIQDFQLRQKTAQLMAVAPGLPVSDIYHRLMDHRGHFEAAKQDLIRRSAKPCASVPPQRPLALARATTVPFTAPNVVREVVDEEPYIKIDMDDPDFMWDHDAPAEPHPKPHTRKITSQVRPKKIAKSTENAVQPARSYKPATTCPRKPTRAMKPRKGHVSKSSKNKGIRDINRGMRETSYDRSFIVSDEEIHDDFGEIYSESDDTDIDLTDDGTDLAIDMELEYAYNFHILSRPSSA